MTASESVNPDLFWGVRSGGGNFGIVTSFEYRLHPVGPTVLAGPIFHPLEDAPEVLRFYREFAAAAPNELTTIFELSVAPPLPFLPQDVHGKPIVMVGGCYAGSPEDGIDVVRPLKEFGSPIVDLLEPKPTWRYSRCSTPSCRTAGTATGSRSSCRRSPTRRSTRSSSTHPPLPRPSPTPSSSSSAAPSTESVPRETAYSQRDAAHNVNINAVWTEDDPEPERHMAWARDFFDALESHASGRVYVNFLGDEGQDRVRAAYGKRDYERLARLKRVHDQTNFFRLNQNIQPG
jgi:FAD/FMN-containing dehydrogenase